MCPERQNDLRDFWLACSLPTAGWQKAIEKFDEYLQLIRAHNASAGLMGPAGVADFPLKHVADSLAAIKAYPALFSGPVRLADVGAGAGLPGIVLAIALPELRLTAIESNRRKADFVAVAAAHLGLAGRVEALARRSRELGREDGFAGAFDVVVARAVAPAEKLIRENRLLLAPGGSMILYKTPQAVIEELPLARREAGKFGLAIETSEVVELPAGTGSRQFIRAIASV